MIDAQMVSPAVRNRKASCGFPGSLEGRDSLDLMRSGLVSEDEADMVARQANVLSCESILLIFFRDPTFRAGCLLKKSEKNLKHYNVSRAIP